jgi:hypothetical protein
MNQSSTRPLHKHDANALLKVASIGGAIAAPTGLFAGGALEWNTYGLCVTSIFKDRSFYVWRIPQYRLGISIAPQSSDVWRHLPDE